MAIVSREVLMAAIHNVLGDNASDNAIKLLEDVDDTLKDYEDKTKDKTDWKSKYEENDKSWRDKYKARFNGKNDDTDNKIVEENEDNNDSPKTFDKLFKEGDK